MTWSARVIADSIPTETASYTIWNEYSLSLSWFGWWGYRKGKFYHGFARVYPQYAGKIARGITHTNTPTRKKESVVDNYLTIAQVAETTDLLGLVKTISSHFHTTHGGHLCVHVHKLFLGDLDIKVGSISLEHVKGRLGKGDSELLRGISGCCHPWRSGWRESTLWNNKVSGTLDVLLLSVLSYHRQEGLGSNGGVSQEASSSCAKHDVGKRRWKGKWWEEQGKKNTFGSKATAAKIRCPHPQHCFSRKLSDTGSMGIASFYGRVYSIIL